MGSHTMRTIASAYWYPQQKRKRIAGDRDRTGDLQIFSLTLSQLSYAGLLEVARTQYRSHSMQRLHSTRCISLRSQARSLPARFAYAISGHKYPAPAPHRHDFLTPRYHCVRLHNKRLLIVQLVSFVAVYFKWSAIYKNALAALFKVKAWLYSTHTLAHLAIYTRIF